MKDNQIEKIIAQSNNRFEFWTAFLNQQKISTVLEIGVYKGAFAATLLKECLNIEKYYMLDPWRNLEDWNKPANASHDTFNQILEDAKNATDFAKEKRVLLRGKTTEVINQLPDESIDFVYIDGDHTLKGIATDLINAWVKLKPNGYIGGDDYTPSIWQHSSKYEPTFIFPFANYFGEAHSSPVFALPYQQFLIHKSNKGFAFKDFTNLYQNTSVRNQLSLKNHAKMIVKSILSVNKTY